MDYRLRFYLIFLLGLQVMKSDEETHLDLRWREGEHISGTFSFLSELLLYCFIMDPVFFNTHFYR